jgi:hypothetical protein
LLGPSDYYVVRILRPVQGQIWPDYQWVRRPSIEQLPDYLFGATGDAVYRWSVAVVTLRSGEAKNDPADRADFIVDYGPERKFQWLSGGPGGGNQPGPRPSNTPIPPPSSTPRP